MKLLVVDDHALLREGVRRTVEALDDDVEVLEAKTADEALSAVQRETGLDLVLLDLGLPDSSGCSALERLRRSSPCLPIVVLSASDERAAVVHALNLGAVGFIPKSYSRDLMIQALRLVLAGGVYIPPQALGLVNGSGASGSPSNHERNADTLAIAHLTQRQSQVLALLAQGKPNKIIARELNISEPTVKAHVTEILRVLGVTNRAQAVIAARRLGVP